jgi:hypothetical protein
MYDEEAFMYQRIVRDNLKLVFDNSLIVYHSDGQTTQKLYKGKKQKWKFQSENILAADKILLECLKNWN